MEALKMADIDIDGMLEKHDKKEKDDKAKKTVYFGVVTGGSVVAAVILDNLTAEKTGTTSAGE